jgi:hypothetical protein
MSESLKEIKLINYFVKSLGISVVLSIVFRIDNIGAIFMTLLLLLQKKN